ncbi:UNVERIFIED_CONTAM: Nucleolar protein 10 [Sesamum angustifolium]|uniref:Nucleolar protein 10 n=1 Tax=Sesamum angustifolium TaxID=2727405 RepID=A0AAW2J9D4_9LAMI
MAYEGGNLKSTSINGVKMYTVAGHNRSLATWLPPKKLRALRKNPGIYPPQVKVYELRELSLKFERHLISEIIDFEVLDDDYAKIAFLCADRSVCLHAKYGSHYSLRIPRMGRDIAYDSWSCDIICAASSPDLYRINLEQGRFLSSLSTQSPALNVVSRSKVHGLVAGGGEDGAVECFDMRTRSSVGRIDVVASAGDVYGEVTAIEFDGDGGYLMVVGSSGGKVLIYDLRSSNPLRVKDHMYGSPILNIKWHKTLNSEQSKLITADKHIVRIWDPETGEGLTSIEPSAGKINDMCVFKESGLILLALDSSQIPSYFIPALGPAPKWCSYLETLTEELEEGGQTTIYDDYKFLTKEDLAKLNLTNLIGTNLLRAYMHGFFIDYRLYKKAQSLADPFAYESYIERRKQEKLEAERSSRITIKRKLPKVNRALAARLLEEEEELNENKGADDADVQKHQMLRKHQRKRKVSPVKFSKMRGLQLCLIIRFYEVKDKRHAEAFWNRESLADEDSLPLGERAALRKPWEVSRDVVKHGQGGSREISFNPRSSSKYKEYDEDEEARPGKRRGIQSLKLSGSRGRGVVGEVAFEGGTEGGDVAEPKYGENL